jgi:DedD protein
LDTQLKQRVVGVMVLLALAIIFLPSLFYREQRVTVDTTSLIPPKPIVKSVELKPAIKPNNVIPAPTPEKAFQPPVVESQVSTKVKSPVTSKPSLNEKGIPNAWVVQVSSFQSQARANELKDRLLSKQYKAYTRAVNTSKGKFYRVFTGPYIDKSRAEKAKTKVDKSYRVNSQVLSFKPE